MEENKNLKPESKNKLSEKEKERLAREKEKQKEKERLAREKEKQKEKERLAREKEKQKEKERLAREKEKQKALPKKQVVLTPKAGVEAKTLVSRVAPEEKQVVTLSDDIDEKELANIKENESKDSLNKMQAIMEARQKLNSGVLDKPSNKDGKIKLGKIILDDEEDSTESKELQALKNRSNAQKALESELISKKDNDLQAKLREASAQFGGLDAIEDAPREKEEKPKVNNMQVEMLQAQLEELEEQLEVLDEALDNAENLEYDGVKVCDPETFELSAEFLSYVEGLKSSSKEGVLPEEVEELKNEHDKQVSRLNDELSNAFAKHSSDVAQYEEKVKLLTEQIDNLLSENKDALSDVNAINESKASLQNEYDSYKESTASQIKALEDKVSDLSKVESVVEELRLELTQKELEIKNTLTQNEESNKNANDLSFKLEEKSSEIETLNNKLKEVEVSKQALQLAIDELKIKLENSVSKEDAQAKLDEELRGLITKCNSLTVDKANLNKKVEEAENNYNALKAQMESSVVSQDEIIAQNEKEKADLLLEITNLKAALEVKTVEQKVETPETAPEEKTSTLKQIGKFFIDSFNGMAHGLFATLIIGVIICQIGSLFNEGTILNTSLVAIGNGLKLLMGVGIGLGIARSLKLDGIKLIGLSVSGGICAYLQNPNGFGANADPLTIYIVVVLTYLVVKYVLSKKTPVDIIIVPLITALIAGALTLLVGDYIKYVTTGIGQVVNSATELNPLPYGIIIAVIMGMCLTAPISSAAIAISIGLDGLAAGAAVVGCSVQMIGFAIQSIRDNNVGKVISVGIGTSMLQFKNILKKPVIWLPTIITSAILGPISTMLFKLECSPTGAGMGTSGLVGILQVFDVMGFNPTSILGVIILMIVAPAALVFGIDLIFRKFNLIKDGDFKI